MMNSIPGEGGCTQKLRAADVRRLKRADNYGFLAANAEASASLGIVSTIDRLEMIGRLSEFPRIALRHCLQDLVVEGCTPEAISLHSQFDINMSYEEVAELSAAVVSATVVEGVELLNQHSTVGAGNALCISSFGKNDWRASKPVRGESYALVLTRALGFSLAFEVSRIRGDERSANDLYAEILSPSLDAIMPLIREFSRLGTTDVSGFGLLGALAGLYEITDEVSLSISEIKVHEISKAYLSDSGASCSLDRNLADFLGVVHNEVGGNIDVSLGLPETCGPLLLVVKERDADNLLEKCEATGLGSAHRIGGFEVCKPGTKGGDQSKFSVVLGK